MVILADSWKQVVEIVQQSGLELMIGGMVETRLAMGFAAHMAAGLGCFRSAVLLINHSSPFVDMCK